MCQWLLCLHPVTLVCVVYMLSGTRTLHPLVQRLSQPQTITRTCGWAHAGNCAARYGLHWTGETTAPQPPAHRGRGRGGVGGDVGESGEGGTGRKEGNGGIGGGEAGGRDGYRRGADAGVIFGYELYISMITIGGI